ncbi:MAG TPA: FkbM family methyltransferase [Pirellulaceae bacterium]|nr:FkbM family methyltransferase [Pirellulaceae bacterium]
MSPSRVAVLGLYRSGSTALAGVLHHLGVDMGAPYFRDYFEPDALARQLRFWWNEPLLEERILPAERVRALEQWVHEREQGGADYVGCKHPLLSLCGQDLVDAWGPDTRFLWSQRPLDESIRSLIRLTWWPNAEEIQRTLWGAATEFFRNQEHLGVEYAEMLADPTRRIEQIVEYLRLEPTQQQIAAAIQSIKPRDQNRTSLAHISRTDQQEAVRDGRGGGKIVATMLCGNSRDLVADAVRSVVDRVDELLLIDTGITDDTARIVGEICGPKFAQVSFPWRDDLSAARNVALQLAADRGATWALTIDTDERMVFNGINSSQQLRARLNAEPEVETWFVSARGGSYAKERIIHVPTSLQWRGRTHEALCGAGAKPRRVLPDAAFWEVPKTPEALRKKLERDLVILREETARTPDNARWWYYLGQTLESLGEHRQAVEAFQRCAAVDTWAEQAAGACYMAANCLCQLQEFQKAVEVCAQGLAKQPESPELAWLAGWCCFKLGEDRDAIAWSRIAIALGNVEGMHSDGHRISFRHLPGWYESPYDVLRLAYQRLGDHTAASEAERQFHRATQLRLDTASPHPSPKTFSERGEQIPAAADTRNDVDSETSDDAIVSQAAVSQANDGKRVLLDLGAHYGESLRWLTGELSIDSTWEVHVFEPNPACQIRQRLSGWPIPVQIHETAAWVRDGTIAFRQQNHRVARNRSPADGRSDIDGWGSCLVELGSSHPALELAIEVPCEDVARMLESYSAEDFIVVKMDVEGAEFAILRHLIQRGVIGRISRLYVEWHERLLATETAETRNELERQLRKFGVQAVAWG